jgi:hypothetical protein
MVQHYARVEFDVVRAVKTLDATGKIPATLNQRVERLRALTDGKTSRDLKALGKSLAVLQQHFERRNVIVHGSGSITVRSGEWLWPWAMWVSPKAQEERGYLTAAEMRQFDKDLKSSSDRLHSLVDRL